MQLTIKKIQDLGLKKQALDDAQFDDFKTHLAEFQTAIKKGVDEKTVEIPLQNFLRDTFYRSYLVNKKTGMDIDLAIFDGKTTDSQVTVLFEIKKPEGNKKEMMSLEKPNAKALHELVLYYFQEIKGGNSSIQHLIVTDLVQWFVFDEKTFADFFRKNTAIKKLFENCYNKKHTTDIFYKDLENLLEKTHETIECIHFNLSKFNPLSKKEDVALLCRFFSPTHLLNIKPTAEDANSINIPFYNELLHILGLRESKNEKGNLVIKRLPKGERLNGSFLELTINRLEITNTFGELKDKDLFGDTRVEQIESVALELCITWLNRILFLKLLEAQIIQYDHNKKNKTAASTPEKTTASFLTNSTIKNFDSLYDLFFEVLAKRTDVRQPHIQKEFGNIPYLNSSLFEIQKESLERQLFSIDAISPNRELPFFKATCLLDADRKRRTGSDLTLRYLLDFLSAYNFGSETDDNNIRSKADSMVNAAVLGKIFEKLNGYKDGAIFTPAFVTMHITRQALRHVALQKIRDTEGVDVQTFEDLKNYCHRFFKAADVLTINALFNSIRLCDPSVGSGHFLVSALNEMMAMKSDLGILADEKGSRLQCRIEIKGDELHIFRHGDTELFAYTPDDPESQRIQETLFREKQTIIENCLYGVDINPKSIAICQLRLWIELLKNTYYTRASGFRELETLPNLDINIFSGDSLVGRYKIQSDGNTIKNTIETFRKRRHDYFKERNSEAKQAVRAEINDLKNKITKGFADRREYWDAEIQKHKTTLIQKYKIKTDTQQAVQSTFDFGEVIPLKLTEKEQISVDNLLKKIEKLNQERQDYERLCRKAFEWRFQIPDVLNEKAEFEGFDIIIGNPPYIPQEELSPAFKAFAERFFRSGSGMSDMLVYFIELSFNLLRPSGVFSMIVSNKFMRAGYGKNLRTFLTNYTPLSIIDFGDLPVFKEATAYPAIIAFENTKINDSRFSNVNDKKQDLVNDISVNDDSDANQDNDSSGKETIQTVDFQCLNPKNLNFDGLTLHDYFEKNSFTLTSNSLKTEGWNLTNENEQGLLEKIKNAGQTLGEYVSVRKIGKKTGEFVTEGQIYRGVSTGCNPAFTIEREDRDRLIAEDPKAAEIIKPFLAGQDIKRYQTAQPKKFMIFTRRGIDIDNYPSVKKHLMGFYARLLPKPKHHVGEWNGRKEGNYKWFEIQDSIEYYEEFDKPKIMFPDISVSMQAIYDTDGAYCLNTAYIILTEDKFILGLLNSKVIHFIMSRISPAIRGGYLRFTRQYVETLPIPPADVAEQLAIARFVETILSKKRLDAQADTQAEERAIDGLVYGLFGIEDGEEIRLIEGK